MGSYVYRRELTRDELLPALGVGLGVGLGVALVTAYVTQMFLRRTPLRTADESRPRHSRESGNPGNGERLLDSRFRGNDEERPGDDAARLRLPPDHSRFRGNDEGRVR